MEWGPRALGNRSILASASTKEMKNILNQKVKKREMFRPFAPVLPVERVADYFETDGYVESLAEHMLLVLPFTKRGRKTAPATVHVDGTGRLQVLRRQANPLYYDLLQEYGKQTGDPILVNTSFNVRGEPIVQSPEDAIRCFLQTEIDALVIGNFIVRKTDVARIV
jgi:carbamoyltransferase